MADTRPTSDAVIASVATQGDVEAVLSELAETAGVASDAVAHGTGDGFAGQLEGGSPDSEPGTRLGRWLTSLGQDREGLVELGQVAREGRYVLVVNDVTDEQTKEAVIAVLQRHGGDHITYIGGWQNEEIL